MSVRLNKEAMRKWDLRLEQAERPSISFTVPGKAVSKSNYRHDSRSRANGAWDRILRYQRDVGESAVAAGAKRFMGKGKVYVRILLVNQPIDPDGVFKAAMDGLKRVAYPDDASKWVRGCQVVASKDDGPVRTVFRIEWEEEDAA